MPVFKTNSLFFLSSVSPLFSLVSFSGSGFSPNGKAYVLIFSDPTDYLAQNIYNYIVSRMKCPDFRDPSYLNMNSANMNTTLLLSYDAIAFPEPAPKGKVVFGEINRLLLIPYSSRWAVFILWCGLVAGGPIEMTGEIEFKNPFGHLAADLYPTMIAHGAILLPLQIAVLALYSLCMARNRRRLHLVQFLLPAVLVLGITASVTRVFYLSRGNSKSSDGTYSITSTSAVVTQLLLFSLFYAAYRWLLFLLAYGSRIVRFSLGAPMLGSMAAYSSVYVAVVAAQLYFDFSREALNVIGPFAVCVLLPAVNFAYVIWVNYYLNQSLSFAATSRQKFKIRLYDRVAIVFYISCFLSTFFGSTYVVKTDVFGGRMWSIWWLFDFYLHLVYVLGLFYLMFLFRPSNRRNALLWYSENTDEANDGEKKSQEENHIAVLSLESDLPERRSASLLAPSKRQLQHKTRSKDSNGALHFGNGFSSDENSPRDPSARPLSLLSSISQEDLPPRRKQSPANRRRKQKDESLEKSAQRALLLSSSPSLQEKSSAP